MLHYASLHHIYFNYCILMLLSYTQTHNYNGTILIEGAAQLRSVKCATISSNNSTQVDLIDTHLPLHSSTYPGVSRQHLAEHLCTLLHHTRPMLSIMCTAGSCSDNFSSMSHKHLFIVVDHLVQDAFYRKYVTYQVSSEQDGSGCQ